MLAADTGQRQGDLLRLPWSAYDGKWITLTQSKTGRKVKVPVTPRLRAVMSSIPRTRADYSYERAPSALGTKRIQEGVVRGTAVTRLSEAGCTPQEIARFTGHSLRDVAAILDRYLARTDKLASTALEKLERARK